MRANEQGSSIVWATVFFAFVVLPVMTLVADSTRLWVISLHVQTATDAACEDAAVSSVDYEHYQQTGQTRFLSGGAIYNIAQSTFSAVLEDTGRRGYSASLSVSPNFNTGIVFCRSSANVPLILGKTTISFSRESESSIRFIGR